MAGDAATGRKPRRRADARAPRTKTSAPVPETTVELLPPGAHALAPEPKTSDDEGEDGPGEEDGSPEELAAWSEEPAGSLTRLEELPADERAPQLTPSRDPVRRFVAEARRFPRLSEEEERALIEAARGQGDLGAARKIVVHNLRLVVSIAYQYRRAWTNLLDLFQEGSVGLMEAVKRWEPSFGTRFSTYAAYWIRAYVLRFLMTNARLIHVGNTRSGRKLFFRLEKERQKLLAAGFEVTPKLLAAKLDVNEEDVEEVSRHLASREVSLEPRPEADGLSIEDKLSARDQASPEEQAARGELSSAVRSISDRFALSLTDERERAVWREHLAATDDPKPLGQLGERFGVSKQRMGQIADRLKKRFRAELTRELGTDIQMSWGADQTSRSG